MAQQIVLVTLSIFSMVHSTLYYPSLINNEYNCNTAAGGSITKNDQCVIHCDHSNTNKDKYTVQCGSAGDCIFFCDTHDCFDTGTIYSVYSNTLTIQSKGRACMRQANVYAPIFGDAFISISSDTISTEDTLKELTIYDGANTNEIYLTCSGNSGKECKDITINAQRTQFLKFIAQNYASLDGAIIKCPQNSNYAGPEPAACIIDVSGKDVSAEYMEIYALNGAPQDVIFTGSTTGDYVGSKLYCSGDKVSNINGHTFDGQPDCWILPTTTTTLTPTTTTTTTTSAPTTTIAPTTTTSAPTTTTPAPTTTTIPPTTTTTTTAAPTTTTATISPTSSPTSIITTTSTAVPTATTKLSTTSSPIVSVYTTTVVPTTSTLITKTTYHDVLTSTFVPIVTTLSNMITTTLITQSTDSILFMSTMDIERKGFEVQKHNELNIGLFVMIFIGLFVLIILLIWCVFIIKKDKMNVVKKGEPERNSIISQDIAPITNNENIDKIAPVNGFIVRIGSDEHIIHTNSLQSNTSMQHILGEGRISQLIITPQMPEMKEEITAEELIEIKRKYNKKKSTLSSDDFGHYKVYKNNLVHIDENKMDREDSEELYVDNEHKNVVVKLGRHHTPTFGLQESQSSDISSTSQSGNPTKATKIRLPSAKTIPHWM